jgi:hypothetical protein
MVLASSSSFCLHPYGKKLSIGSEVLGMMLEKFMNGYKLLNILYLAVVVLAVCR